jgi:hypothetical protein
LPRITDVAKVRRIETTDEDGNTTVRTEKVTKQGGCCGLIGLLFVLALIASGLIALVHAL